MENEIDTNEIETLLKGCYWKLCAEENDVIASGWCREGNTSSGKSEIKHLELNQFSKPTQLLKGTGNSTQGLIPESHQP